MITVTIDPSESNLVKNRMVSRYETDRYVVTAGQRAQIVFQFTGTGAAVGESIAFTLLLGQSITMVFAATLDDSGLKLRTNTGALPLAGFIAQVAEDLATNFYLQDYFTISYNSTTITLTAKETGNDFTTVVLESVTGMSVLTNTTGVDEVLADNHRIRLDIRAEDSYGSNVYNDIAAMEEEPFGSVADFDISELLRYSFTRPDLPDFYETNTIRCKFAYKRYKITYSEKYGTPATFKKAATIGPFFAYFAGASYREFPLAPTLLDYFSAQKYFLTWQPTTKKSYSNSQDYLYFYVAGGVSAFRVKVYAAYDDGTFSTAYPWTRTTPLAGEVYRIPTGYKNLVDTTGVFTVGKTVKWYEVSVDDNGGTPVILADPFRYNMVYRAQYHRSTFIFNNSLPAMETLETTGELVTGIEVEAFVAERAREFTNASVSEEMFKTYAEKQDVFKQSTGWHTKERIDKVIDELFLANHVYLADTVKGEWIPVVINKGSVEKFRTIQDLYAVNFEYTYAFREVVTTGDVDSTSALIVASPMSVTIAATTSTLVIDSSEPLTTTTE